MMRSKYSEVDVKMDLTVFVNKAWQNVIMIRLRTFYAGFIMCFVPLVMCNSDRRSHLTFDTIYNNTEYAQIRPGRPYQTLNLSFLEPNNNVKTRVPINRYKEFENNNNVLDYGEEDYYKNKHPSSHSGQLLVGFSADPYRYSIPEAEYMKGVRSYQPQPSVHDMKSERGKRGVGHLYNMISCATGCDPLSYKGYGCYCGFLGAGRTTDGIDRCCRMHDKCYENLYCPFFTVYFQPYYWKCYHGEPLCALENHETRHQLINGCAGQLCECDRLLAMCLRQYRCPKRRALCRSSPLRLLQNILMSK